MSSALTGWSEGRGGVSAAGGGRPYFVSFGTAGLTGGISNGLRTLGVATRISPILGVATRISPILGDPVPMSEYLLGIGVGFALVGIAATNFVGFGIS